MKPDYPAARSQPRATIALAATLTIVFGSVGAAETITTRCQGQEFGKPYELTMVYEGEDSGTMKITGSFGDMSLPATKKAREGVNTDGDKVSATEIWPSGEIPIVVPDKAAIEACIKGKLPPDQVTDSDIVFSTIPTCAAFAPRTSQPIPVKVVCGDRNPRPDKRFRNLQADRSGKDGSAGRRDRARAATAA